MLHAVLDIVKDRFVGQPYVDRFGGLAIPIRKVVFDNMGLSKTVVFPVSCGAESKACWENGKYGDLVPDSNRKSVFYFEQLREFRPTGNDRQTLEMSSEFRLVGWLNLPKLGHVDDCMISSKVSLSIIELLTGIHDAPVGSEFENANIDVRFVSQPQKSADLFRQYTYGNDLFALLLYPYDYFALDFSVKLSLPRGCISDFVPNSPVDCVDFQAV